MLVLLVYTALISFNQRGNGVEKEAVVASLTCELTIDGGVVIESNASYIQ